MTPSKRPARKRARLRPLQDARKAVETLKDVSRFQTALLERLEKAIDDIHRLCPADLAADAEEAD